MAAAFKFDCAYLKHCNDWYDWGILRLKKGLMVMANDQIPTFSSFLPSSKTVPLSFSSNWIRAQGAIVRLIRLLVVLSISKLLLNSAVVASFFIHNRSLIKMLSNIGRWKQILKGKNVMFQYFLLFNLNISIVPFYKLLFYIITIVRSILLTLRMLDNIRPCCCSTKELSDATERWYWNKNVVSISLCRAHS